MPVITLQSDLPAHITEKVAESEWIVACLCAAWCGVCTAYRVAFDELAQRHPDKVFVWIDVEDNADLIGDIDIENFPTLLMQHRDIVAFYGTMLPDTRIAERVLRSCVEQPVAELRKEAASTPERQKWQQEFDVRQWLNISQQALGSA
jgi:thioredoxin 1